MDIEVVVPENVKIVRSRKGEEEGGVIRISGPAKVRARKGEILIYPGGNGKRKPQPAPQPAQMGEEMKPRVAKVGDETVLFTDGEHVTTEKALALVNLLADNEVDVIATETQRIRKR